jgi:hypothetical protein
LKEISDKMQNVQHLINKFYPGRIVMCRIQTITDDKVRRANASLRESFVKFSFNTEIRYKGGDDSFMLNQELDAIALYDPTSKMDEASEFVQIKGCPLKAKIQEGVNSYEITPLHRFKAKLVKIDRKG